MRENVKTKVYIFLSRGNCKKWCVRCVHCVRHPKKQDHKPLFGVHTNFDIAGTAEYSLVNMHKTIILNLGGITKNERNRI